MHLEKSVGCLASMRDFEEEDIQQELIEDGRRTTISSYVTPLVFVPTCLRTLLTVQDDVNGQFQDEVDTQGGCRG